MNPQGVQGHLDYWLYGLVKVSEGLGNTRALLREIQEETIQQILEKEHLTFPKDADPVEVLRMYNQHLDEKGILDADDITYHRGGACLTVTISESCPYRTTCSWLHDEGTPLPCFRAIAMGELLRIATRRTCDGKLTRFGVPCHVTFRHIRMGATEDGD